MHKCEVFCAKYTVFSLYILASFAALISIVTGLVYFFSFGHHENFAVHQLWSFSFLLIIIGIVVFLFTLMGSLGTIAKSPCFLLIPTIFLTMILAIQCGIGLFGAIKPDQADFAWSAIFNDTFKYYEDNNEVWDFMQRELKCCGINYPNDWVNSGKSLPNSCCFELLDDTPCIPDTAFQMGCKSEFLTFLKENSTTIVSVLFGITLIEILTIVWSCFLYGVFR